MALLSPFKKDFNKEKNQNRKKCKDYIRNIETNLGGCISVPGGYNSMRTCYNRVRTGYIGVQTGYNGELTGYIAYGLATTAFTPL